VIGWRRTSPAARLEHIRSARGAGDYRRAAQLARRAIRVAARQHGREALEVAPFLNELGVIGKYRGTFAEADRAYLRAMAIYETHGDESAMASVLHNMGGLAHARGDAGTAEELARRGIRMREAMPVPDRRALAQDRAALAAILVDRGSLREAAALLDDALRNHVWQYRTMHHETAVSLHNLGSLRFRAGDSAGAAEALGYALEVKSRMLGDAHPEVAITLHNLACCYVELADPDRAIAHLRRAVDILQAVVPGSHPTLVSSRSRLRELGA
jgi:tetratricopeptide (TPR) repeat protein